MKLIYIILLLFFISLTQATIYFSNPTPLNNTSNFSYGLVFNITTDTGFICGTSRIEINGS